MKISLWRRHALTVADSAFSHKKDHVTIFKEILNQNRITGSKVLSILLIGWIFPIGGASSEGSTSAACTADLFFQSIGPL